MGSWIGVPIEASLRKYWYPSVLNMYVIFEKLYTYVHNLSVRKNISSSVLYFLCTNVELLLLVVYRDAAPFTEKLKSIEFPTASILHYTCWIASFIYFITKVTADANVPIWPAWIGESRLTIPDCFELCSLGSLSSL